MSTQTIKYNDGYVMYVTNENNQYIDELMYIASQDTSHPLYKNYQNVDIKRFVFCNIIVHNNIPVMFWGTEIPNWCPPNVGRAFVRTYKNPAYRERNTWLEQGRWMRQVLNYDEYSLWLNRYNISNLIYTRNVVAKKDSKGWLSRIGNWSEYPQTCLINQTLQRVYYWKQTSDLDFLKALHQ